MRTGLLRVPLYIFCAAAIIILSQFVVELRRAAEDQVRADFDSYATIFTRDFEHAVTSAINHTLGIGALLESSKSVNEVEFSRFIIRSRILAERPSIRAVAAIPLLSRAELPAFKTALATRKKSRGDLGYPPFELKEFPDRDVYAPIVYVESFAGRKGILGQDIASSRELMATARSALLLAQPHVTPPIPINEDADKNSANVLIFSAIKSIGNMGLRNYKDPTEDRTTLIAVSFAPYISITSIFNKLQLHDTFDIYVEDITDTQPAHIYGTQQVAASGALTHVSRLVFGNRVWRLTYTSTSAINGWQDTKKFVFLAGVVILLIVALTVTLDRLIKSRDALELQVNDRTQQLNSMNVKLQASIAKASAESDAKSLFLAHMSHELRTPLNAVIGYAQMLKTQLYGELGDKRYFEYAETIENAGNIQLQLVEDILALISLQGGTRQLERKPVHLETVANKCIELVKQRANEKDLTIDLVSVMGSGTFLGDERSIQQIIINLLSNAIKFTPPQGRITVRLSRDNLGTITIAVEDTGIGIEEKYLNTVLQPFGQAKVNPYSAHEGVGLGLSIVTGLANACGGTVRIQSEYKKGTTVIVELPPRKESNSHAENI